MATYRISQSRGNTPQRPPQGGPAYSAAVDRVRSTPTKTVLKATNINERQRQLERDAQARMYGNKDADGVGFTVDATRRMARQKLQQGLNEIKARGTLQGKPYLLDDWHGSSLERRALDAGVSPHQLTALQSTPQTSYGGDDLVTRERAQRGRLMEYVKFREEAARQARNTPTNILSQNIHGALDGGTHSPEQLSSYLTSPTMTGHYGAGQQAQALQGHLKAANPDPFSAMSAQDQAMPKSNIDDLIDKFYPELRRSRTSPLTKPLPPHKPSPKRRGVLGAGPRIQG